MRKAICMQASAYTVIKGMALVCTDSDPRHNGPHSNYTGDRPVYWPITAKKFTSVNDKPTWAKASPHLFYFYTYHTYHTYRARYVNACPVVCCNKSTVWRCISNSSHGKDSHAWSIASQKKEALVKPTKKYNASKKKTEKKPYPEEVIRNQTYIPRGRIYPEPVEWEAGYSVTNQEGKYIPIERRTCFVQTLGKYKTEGNAVRAAKRHNEKMKVSGIVRRIDWVEPVERKAGES